MDDAPSWRSRNAPTSASSASASSLSSPSTTPFIPPPAWYTSNAGRGGGGSSIHFNISRPLDDMATGRGIVIGMLSALGSAMFIVLVFCLVYCLRFTQGGRILLDRVGRPGSYDDEQARLREEAEALETMGDLDRQEYLRAKAFIEAYPPETMQTDISLSQFLAIQEKGVSAWEFEPELEIANCFVEGRTEIEFFDSECTVQSNLPIPKQNEVYYWEAKIYDKPESTLINIGVTTKPYPLFRLPGLHRTSIAYTSTGQRRFNQPFTGTNYGPEFVQGDVIGVGYRPRTGTVFFTRNGKKLEDVTHGLKSQNFFPSVGANGPCHVHVNFGQSGFVFIEANVKKWGLAPMTGSLAPPPPYGSEQGSILLEAGGHEAPQSQSGSYTARHPPGHGHGHGHGRQNSRFRPVLGGPLSPGPVRSPTDISLAQLVHVPSEEDIGEGTSRSAGSDAQGLGFQYQMLPDRNSNSLTPQSHGQAQGQGQGQPHHPTQLSSSAQQQHQQHQHLSLSISPSHSPQRFPQSHSHSQSYSHPQANYHPHPSHPTNVDTTGGAEDHHHDRDHDHGHDETEAPPPDYESPQSSPATDDAERDVPSYDAAMAETRDQISEAVSENGMDGFESLADADADADGDADADADGDSDADAGGVDFTRRHPQPRNRTNEHRPLLHGQRQARDDEHDAGLER